MTNPFSCSTSAQWAGRGREFWKFLAIVLLWPIFSISPGQAQEEPLPIPDPTLLTDRSEYAPGATAFIRASGFQPGENVTLQLSRADGTPTSGPDDGPWQGVANDAGMFSGSWMVCQHDCVGSSLRLTALGQSSALTAQTIFAVLSAYVVTDRSDYAPGSTANIAGDGFQPGETVVLQVLHADEHPSTGAEHGSWATVTDANGAFQTTWHVCEDDCAGSTLQLSAVGQASGLSAFAFFTDACPTGGGEVDPTFDPGSAPDDQVLAVALQPDGKVLIGGLFRRVDGALRLKIARLNSDGSTDGTFLNGMAGLDSTFSGFGEVYSVVVQPDGKVLVGGLFSTVNGVSRVSLARLNTDGSLDTAFVPTLGGSSPAVHAIAVQPDGKILIGGTFITVNGVSRIRIARLNSDGNLDTTFQNLMAGASFTVLSIVVQPDSNVLIGGRFTTVNGTNRGRIARLNGVDGSLDMTFQAGASNDVNSVALQLDGKVLIGGAFTTVNATPRGRIARLNGSDGTLDTTFNTTNGANSTVLSVALQADGKIVIGGLFSTVNSTNRGRIARLNTDGTLDTTFQNGMAGTSGTLLGVAAVVVQPDAQVLIGGQFTGINDSVRRRIARLNTDGSLDATFKNGPAGPDDDVEAMALQVDGKLVIGGRFTSLDAVRNRIARVNSDGSLDTTFQNGLTGANNTVLAVAVQSDGKVLLAGQFSTVNGVARARLARVNSDGTLDLGFAASANATVQTIALQPDGKILVGGQFSQINTSNRGRLTRLNSNGTLDTTFLPVGTAGPDLTVESVVVQSDGQVVIGGQFTTVNGTPRGRIARLNSTDGSVDTTFLNGPTGVIGTVFSVALQPDGKVVIGGSFTSVNSMARTNVARLNTDGTLDAAFQARASSVVNSVAVHSDGKVVIGGGFTLVNGVSRNRIARLNTDGSIDTTFQNGMLGANDAVSSVLIQPDDKVLVGGLFTLVNGVVRERVVRLLGSGIDTTAPVITCPSNQVASTAPGQCSAVVNYPPATASDDCSTPTASCSPASGSIFPKGVTTVTCTATDGSGNTASCSFTVTVNDNQPPIATCPANIVTNTAAGACNAVVTYAASASDNCPGASLACTPVSGSSFPKGTNTVTCTATDTSGNTASCSFTVRVNDNQAPVLTGCPAPTATFQCFSQVPSPAVVTANDNCDGATPVQFNETQSIPGSSCSNVITRTWTATDSSGNSASCTQTITVQDTTPPTITCPTNIAVQCMELVPVPDTSTVTTSDNCGGGVTVLWESDTQSNPDVSCNNVITRTYRAVDACQNVATCTQTITVNDTMAPVFSGCPAPTASAQCLSEVPPPASVTASDNCDGSVPVQFTESQSNPGSSCNNVITRTWTATDACGNSATCTQTITVNDTTPPSITCPPNIIAETDPGACAAVVNYTVTANDNCSSVNVVCSPASGSEFPKGTTSVNCEAGDLCDNTATCSFTVTINDNEDPVITCPADIPVASGSLCSGGGSGAVTYPSPTVNDNCAVAGVSCTPPSGSTFPAGSTTVTCTVTDTSSNTAHCTFTVTVQAGGVGDCETIQATPDRSRVHFNSQGQSQFAFFRGSLEMTGGNLAPDFRVVPGNTAHGALKITLGSTVVYCNENLTFTVHDCADPANNREKWKYNAGPLEKMFLRWKDDQEYDATRDPNLPVSAATGNRNLGKLETRFIHDEETRFRFNFKDAAKPVTITVDGLVLLTVNASGAVSSPFPHWKYGKTVDVLFPDRLVPGNTIAWYNDDLSNNGGLPENLVYQHEASASGTATDTYFNAGGRFFIKVPVTGVNLTSLPRSAQVQFTLGQQGLTLVGYSDFTVPSYSVVGQNWKFNDGPDDCESED